MTNTFQATSPADAVRQMIEWVVDNAGQTGYRVTPEATRVPVFIDADDLPSL